VVQGWGQAQINQGLSFRLDEKRGSRHRQQYSQLPESQTLIELWRKEIVAARVRLATDRNLTAEERQAFWLIVDAPQWFLQMMAKDYEAELEQIARQLEAELD
jgi:hypothetical protein